MDETLFMTLKQNKDLQDKRHKFDTKRRAITADSWRRMGEELNHEQDKLELLELYLELQDLMYQTSYHRAELLELLLSLYHKLQDMVCQTAKDKNHRYKRTARE